MSERTRRATEAVEAHYDFLNACVPGGWKDDIEGPLLDVARDPNDVRYGHGEFLYGKGKSFQGWLGRIANEARTFAATTDLWREVLLTVDMMQEEGIDWLPLQPHHVPAKSGLILFPYGVPDPTHIDYGVSIVNGKGGKKYVQDDGMGERFYIDGFLWEVSDKVSRNGFADEPVEGVTVLPLTRYRDDDTDRPFRLAMRTHPGLHPRGLVASDLTAWAFDEDGQFEWAEVQKSQSISKVDPDAEFIDQRVEQLTANRIWIRSLVWATWRWLSEEVWIPESPSRPVQRKMARKRQPIHTNPPQEDGEVVIVDLRLERKEAIARGEAGGEPPWWRTRWIVRGHWAKRRAAIRDIKTNEPVGPVRGPGSVEGKTFYYRKVFIEPYIKGDDSMPLVLKDRVGVLCR